MSVESRAKFHTLSFQVQRELEMVTNEIKREKDLAAQSKPAIVKPPRPFNTVTEKEGRTEDNEKIQQQEFFSRVELFLRPAYYQLTR